VSSKAEGAAASGRRPREQNRHQWFAPPEGVAGLPCRRSKIGQQMTRNSANFPGNRRREVR
jgi:hypothetical protein